MHFSWEKPDYSKIFIILLKWTMTPQWVPVCFNLYITSQPCNSDLWSHYEHLEKEKIWPAENPPLKLSKMAHGSEVEKKRNLCIKTTRSSPPPSLLILTICSKPPFPGARGGGCCTAALVWLCKWTHAYLNLLIIQSPLRISVVYVASHWDRNI